jgi:hypothetical protein
MTPKNRPNDDEIPPEAAPFMGILLAARLHNGDISGFLRGEPAEVLQDVATQIKERESLINPFLDGWDLPALDGPSWWMTDVVPAIDREVRRRTQPMLAGGGRIAELKASFDLLDVAQRYTRMARSGPGAWKGLCPLHTERTPSFYVYVDSQYWRCYGACARGGDVINLLAVMDGKNG